MRLRTFCPKVYVLLVFCSSLRHSSLPKGNTPRERFRSNTTNSYDDTQKEKGPPKLFVKCLRRAHDCVTPMLLNTGRTKGMLNYIPRVSRAQKYTKGFTKIPKAFHILLLFIAKQLNRNPLIKKCLQKIRVCCGATCRHLLLHTVAPKNSEPTHTHSTMLITPNGKILNKHIRATREGFTHYCVEFRLFYDGERDTKTMLYSAIS